MTPQGGEIEYCDSWDAQSDEVDTPLSEAEARARDAAGEAFVAVLRRPGRRPVMVEVSGETDTITVTFFDEHLRQNLKYWFYGTGDKRMFLTEVAFWEYPDDNPRLGLSKASLFEAVTFREDGYMQRIVTNVPERVRDITEYRDVPVEGNYEPVPAFGDYWSIARRERPTDEPARGAAGGAL